MKTTISAGTSKMCRPYNLAITSVPGNSPPNSPEEMLVPITGIPLIIPSIMRNPLPESRSSGSEYPVKPAAIPRMNSMNPTNQLISLGLRNAPVKKTLSM